MPARSGDEVDLDSLMEPVARRLLGEPNPRLSTNEELRWGNNGSLAVKGGHFFDHEAKQGGGVVRLVELQLPIDHLGAWRWLRQEYPEAFPPSQLNGHGGGRRLNITKAYDYLDADSTLLQQVCRTIPKGFVQRRPDPSAESGWDWHTRGVKPVPYRLPELLADIAAGRTVYICEGEKDVDNLRAKGLASTTNAGGCGKWRSELNQYLRGADVVIIADNDPQAKNKTTGELLWHPDGRPQLPGQDHAAHVAGQLSGVAARVRLLDLGKLWTDCPPKGDVSDFLDAGKTVADLEALAAGLPDWGPPAPQGPSFTADILAPIPVPVRQWHVEGLIPDKQVTLLSGDGGVGKSTLALQLCAATVAGLPWLGLKPRLGRALYISCEDDRDELHRRLDLIGLHYQLGLDAFAGLKLWPLAEEDALLMVGQPGQPLQTTARGQEFKAMVEDWQPALTVVDSSADVYGGNENDRPSVRGFVRWLRSVCAPCSGALVLLAHPSLVGISSGSGLSGSTAWNNSVRSRLYLTLPITEEGAPASTDLRHLKVMKANYGPSGGDLVVRYETGAFVLDDPESMNALDRALAVDRIDEQFMALLLRYNAQNRPLSIRPSGLYAPKVFSQDPEAKGTAMPAFRNAMNRLFAAGRIRVIEEKVDGKRRERLMAV